MTDCIDTMCSCRGGPCAECAEGQEIARATKYDDVLVPFMALMRAELHANSHKGDREAWVNLTRDGSMFEVYDHSAKLAAALRANDHARIRERAADVANAALMVLDAWGLLVPAAAAAQFDAEADRRSRHAAAAPWLE